MSYKGKRKCDAHCRALSSKAQMHKPYIHTGTDVRINTHTHTHSCIQAVGSWHLPTHPLTCTPTEKFIYFSNEYEFKQTIGRFKSHVNYVRAPARSLIHSLTRSFVRLFDRILDTYIPYYVRMTEKLVHFVHGLVLFLCSAVVILCCFIPTINTIL